MRGALVCRDGERRAPCCSTAARRRGRAGPRGPPCARAAKARPTDGERRASRAPASQTKKKPAPSGDAARMQAATSRHDGPPTACMQTVRTLCSCRERQFTLKAWMKASALACWAGITATDLRLSALPEQSWRGEMRPLLASALQCLRRWGRIVRGLLQRRRRWDREDVL